MRTITVLATWGSQQMINLKENQKVFDCGEEMKAKKEMVCFSVRWGKFSKGPQTRSGTWSARQISERWYWNKGKREAAGGVSVVYFQGWRDECAGQDGDALCRLLLERCTGPQTENVMRHKGLQAHIKQMIPAWLMSSWHYQLRWGLQLMPAAEEEDRVRRSTWTNLSLCLMHTKIIAKRRVSTFYSACPLAIWRFLLLLHRRFKLTQHCKMITDWCTSWPRSCPPFSKSPRCHRYNVEWKTKMARIVSSLVCIDFIFVCTFPLMPNIVLLAYPFSIFFLISMPFLTYPWHVRWSCWGIKRHQKSNQYFVNTKSMFSGTNLTRNSLNFYNSRQIALVKRGLSVWRKKKLPLAVVLNPTQETWAWSWWFQLVPPGCSCLG